MSELASQRHLILPQIKGSMASKRACGNFCSVSAGREGVGREGSGGFGNAKPAKARHLRFIHLRQSEQRWMEDGDDTGV